MGSPSPFETFVAVDDLPRERPTPSAPFRRIAVCVDGSRMGGTLVLQAAAIAEAFGAPLTIVRDIRQRQARTHLDRLVALALRPNVHISVELVQGSAAEQICCWASEHQADLTVLASHGEHGRSRWPLSSTARKLVEGIPGSLLLVPANGGQDERAVRYRRIMVPLDGSARAESVLPIASRLATAHEAELLVAHVTPAPELTTVGPFTAQDLDLEQRLIARNERVAHGYLEQVRARLSEAGIGARTIVSRGGDARTRLARLVRREGVDLIVLSAYGRRGPRDTPCGSVAAHLL